MTTTTRESLTYLTPSDAAPKRNDAVARIREMLGSGNVIGAEAHEFKPGSVVLLAFTHPAHADRRFVEQLRTAANEIADELALSGIRAVCVTFPEDVNLRAFEVPDAARGA